MRLDRRVHSKPLDGVGAVGLLLKDALGLSLALAGG